MSPLYPDLPDGHIRILTLQPGDETTSLSGVLRSVPLESAPDFEAVSYAWGTEEFTDTLDIAFATEPNSGEKELSGSISITPNVTSLLRSLRNATDHRVLWIDAICINQANASERSAQVRLMRQIYGHARRVVIWLGVATENGESDRALRFLQRMGTYKKKLEDDQKAYRLHDSDEVSEFGHDDGSLTFSDLDHWSDDDDDEGSAGLFPEFTPDEDDLKWRNWPEHMRTSDYTPKFIQDHSSELGRLGFDDEGPASPSSLSILSLNANDHMAGELLEQTSDDETEFQERTTRNAAKERAEMAVDFDCIIKPGVSHIAVGYPVVCDMDGHHFDPFFHKRFHLDWAAVDGLLSRPWWSRVWVVQEVWSASDRAILQCGQQTIRWKAVQRAMSYHDAWDEMSHALKDKKSGRAGIWTQLQRRYGLANHLCKMTLLDGKLSSLLWNTWDRDATDPRDKVFAVLGLVGDENSRFLTSPDYGKGVRQVFCETARDIINAEGSLNILLAAGSSKGECDDGVLPSWVPDWRRKANESRPVLFVNRARLSSPYFSGSLDFARVFGHGYTACGEEKAVARFGDSLATLRARAVLVDEVGSWCGVPQDSGPVMFKPIIDDACAVAYDALKDGTQYWWMEDEKDKVRARERKGMDYRSMTRWAEKPKKAGLQAVVERVLCAGSAAGSTLGKVVQNVMPLRRFFVTRGARYLSIGPASLRPGDKVFVIAGCNFPLILREVADDNGAGTGEYELIGEAYGKQLIWHITELGRF
ncbi:heterokaryon incompatibility protein [Colletotrichum plurivorum]|uniref:Heterokaryon incompatibility protein n=1 Tax=Colletotrichum plurivorum TaxID=2175906 RepID=A0A8H6KXA4_9PEZI|nr:heterokaryon incompatibility protein [Colletotrichum plurivorum]